MTTISERISHHLESGRLDDAEKELQSAGPDAISEVDRLVLQGKLLQRQHDWNGAVQAFERALELDEDHIEASFHLARICDRFGDDERAIDLYENIVAVAPTHVNAVLNLAVLYEDEERYHDAFDCVQRVLTDHPNHPRARLFLKDIEAAQDMYYDEDRERFREKRDAILDTPISDFELSVRSRNCLKQMDIHTLGDLLKTTASELLSYKNFGETSLHEIENMLTQKGLRLGQLLEDQGGDVRFNVPPGTDPAKANIMSRSVAELELSVRSRKCLMRLGINTIGELCQRSEPELLGIKNFGMTSLAEIKKRLTEFGLSLKGG